jgi:hypothetical protein
MRVCLAILVGCLLGAGGTDAADSNATVVAWQAPTKDWPSALWVYKVVPGYFPPAVISNLLAMASFSMAENQSVPGKPGYENDKIPPLYFATGDGKRHLGIAPSFGYVEYRDSTVEGSVGQRCVGVPTDEEAYPLALGYLRKFGIDRSQLASKPSTNAYTGKDDLGIRREIRSRDWIDKKTRETVEDVYGRGIFFVRRIDGLDVEGIVKGGVYICFGEHSKISELKITWRGLEPFELRPTVTPDQIVAEIRLGHARWRPYQIGAVRKTTVFGFELFYRGQPGDTEPEKLRPYVEPYAVVYASLSDGSTNELKCFAEMPVLGATGRTDQRTAK